MNGRPHTIRTAAFPSESARGHAPDELCGQCCARALRYLARVRRGSAEQPIYEPGETGLFRIRLDPVTVTPLGVRMNVCEACDARFGGDQCGCHATMEQDA